MGEEVTQQIEEANVVVVGGGPAGVSVAVEAQLAGIDKVIVLEKGDTHNYMISKLYTAGKRVDTVWKGIDVPAEGALYITPGNRETYLETMQAYIEKNKVDLRYNQEVWQIVRGEDGWFNVSIGPDRTIHTKTVVIAIGVMGKPNKPDYKIPPAIKDRVQYSVAEREFKDERVLVVGGGDTASEAVQYLYPANDVVLSYRRPDFGRMNEINEKILSELGQKGEATLWNPTNIEALEVSDDGRVKVVFADKDPREEIFDQVVYCLGGSSPVDFLKAIGLQFDSRYPEVNPDTHETQIPGLYLAGDLALEGKGSITTAFNTGRRIVEKGLCNDHFVCEISPAMEVRSKVDVPRPEAENAGE